MESRSSVQNFSPTTLSTSSFRYKRMTQLALGRRLKEMSMPDMWRYPDPALHSGMT